MTVTPSATSGRLSFTGVAHSEWIKLRTLRSTVWLYVALVVVSLALAALMASSVSLGGGTFRASDQVHLAVTASVFGVFFGQLIVAVIGVLTISGEYSTGMIRSTLTAVPRRLPVLFAKAVVLFLVTFVVGVVSDFGAFFVAGPLLAAKGIDASATDPRVFVPLLGGGLYLGLVAVFALGLGTVLRNSAAGITIVLGILLLLPTVLEMIPGSWTQDTIPSYLISAAGINMLGVTSFSTVMYQPWQDFLIVMGWVLVWGAAGAALLKRRDA
jgi:ABC-2 type transport system permease protein